MMRIILFSPVNYVCNVISVLCIWDVFPYDENNSHFSRELRA